MIAKQENMSTTVVDSLILTEQDVAQLSEAVLIRLASEFGVKLVLNKQARTLSLSACDEDVLEVAKHRVREELGRGLQTLAEELEARSREQIHVVVDLSNVYLCSQLVQDGARGPVSRNFKGRLNIPELVNVVEQGRDARTRQVMFHSCLLTCETARFVLLPES
jgi:hypothetical protein